MVTPTFDISEYGLRSISAAPRGDDESLRYRFDVVAASAVDAVQSAGGWLYDRAMAGWEVVVLLPHGPHVEDDRPLRILGVQVSELESGATAKSLAVSAEAFAADERVRDRVLKARGDRLTEVALWGEHWPLEMNRGLTRVQHVLSGAARRFKRQALVAAGIPCESVDPTETLLTDSVRLG
jgi:hypothetical protein